MSVINHVKMYVYVIVNTIALLKFRILKLKKTKMNNNKNFMFAK